MSPVATPSCYPKVVCPQLLPQLLLAVFDFWPDSFPTQLLHSVAQRVYNGFTSRDTWDRYVTPLGNDRISGKNFDHRKQWLESALVHLAKFFGIDLLCYAILSYHFHLVLRSRPDVRAAWDDSEVARRWTMLCPRRRDADKKPQEPNEYDLNMIRNHPVRLKEIRSRLSDVSWWLRLFLKRKDEIGACCHAAGC